MARAKSRVSPDAATAASVLVQETIRTALHQDGTNSRWFPYGIDALSLNVSVGGDGVQIALSLAGPGSAGLTAYSVRTAPLTEQPVMDACKKAYQLPANRNDCNEFVKFVAAEVGAKVDAGSDADDIVDSFSSPAWTELTRGDHAAAMAKAAAGKFVVAGMKKAEFSKPHSYGHVAVVHGHEVPTHPGFPCASWGSKGGTGAQASTFNGSIRDTFAPVDLDKIHYAYQNI